VLFNAAAALIVAGATASLAEGVGRAAGAIDRGDARRVLDRLRAASQE
jgi:anthranilate phosphoribosyltransferase